MDNDIETNLEHLADEKQEKEVLNIKEQKKLNKQAKKGTGQIVSILENN